jgi:hypothetical protein
VRSNFSYPHVITNDHPIAANPVSSLSVIFTSFVRNLGCLSVTIDSIKNKVFNGKNYLLISQIDLKLLTVKGHVPVWLEKCPFKLIFENQKYFGLDNKN